MSSSHWLIIPAAGLGARMQNEKPKQYLSCHGKTILETTVNQFLSVEFFEKVIIAISPADTFYNQTFLSSHPRCLSTLGGETRAHSVYNGLMKLKKIGANEADWVWVHDAARPCITSEDILKLYSQTKSHYSGVILASPARDTFKKVKDNQILTTVDRSELWHAMTPQVFPFADLMQAMSNTIKQKLSVTDEAMSMELLNFPITVIQGRADNIKITYPIDLTIAETILR